MATDIPGIDSALAAQYTSHQWRLLTSSRSMASGVYKRGDDATFTTPLPLCQHHKTAQKPGFVLVEIVNAQVGLTGVWTPLVD